MEKRPKVIVLIENWNEYGRGVIYGIGKYSRLHRPWLLYIRPSRKAKTGGQKTFQPENWDADGFIIFDMEVRADQLAEIIKKNIPIVIRSLNKPYQGCINIVSDNDAVGRMAAEYFRSKGFENLAFCGFDNLAYSKERQSSFLHELKNKGLQTYVYKQPRSKEKRLWKNEQKVLMDWLKTLPKPIGIFACDDERGIQLIELCNMLEYEIPDEVAILGCDNNRLICDLCNPSLSSISRNFEAAGYEAARRLHQYFTNEKNVRENIPVNPTYVVTRQSTDVLAIRDDTVSKAVRFIHDNADTPVQVSDVADYVAISERTLQRKFNRIFGHSVYRRIQKERLERATMMLIETHRSITQIGLSLGFGQPSDFIHNFKRQTGISPSEYRRKFGVKDYTASNPNTSGAGYRLSSDIKQQFKEQDDT